MTNLCIFTNFDTYMIYGAERRRKWFGDTLYALDEYIFVIVNAFSRDFLGLNVPLNDYDITGI